MNYKMYAYTYKSWSKEKLQRHIQAENKRMLGVSVIMGLALIVSGLMILL